jgi:hypothetical protein
MRVGRWSRQAPPLGVLLALLMLLTCDAAQAITYAPVNARGPALSVPSGALKAALACTSGLAGSSREPILLVPGTAVDPAADFSWNWERALSAQHWPYCTIALPGNSMGDVQIAGQYVVYAIRRMHALSKRRVEIVGHSQGGMVPRWALRFWPNTRKMVDDVIGLSPSNHGTLDAIPLCAIGCAPAIWQQRSNAAFIAALNSGQETFPGISYTAIYTDTDEIVVPNLGGRASSALHGGGGQITNVAIQQVCPLDLSEHLGVGTYDNTAYQLGLDALTHPGPADPARLSRGSVCSHLLMPGVRPLTFVIDFANTVAFIGRTLATYPRVSAEPPLACYVTGHCTVVKHRRHRR